jgi:hypothetical protein
MMIFDRLDGVGALHEEKEGGQIRHTLQDRAWHPYISLTDFIWGGAIAACSRGHQLPTEREGSGSATCGYWAEYFIGFPPLQPERLSNQKIFPAPGV